MQKVTTSVLKSLTSLCLVGSLVSVGTIAQANTGKHNQQAHSGHKPAAQHHHNSQNAPAKANPAGPNNEKKEMTNKPANGQKAGQPKGQEDKKASPSQQNGKAENQQNGDDSSEHKGKKKCKGKKKSAKASSKAKSKAKKSKRSKK